MNIKLKLIAILILMAIFARITLAQSALSLSSVNPQTVTAGQSEQMTLSGSGFVEATVVQVSGIGNVTASFVNETTLTFDMPQVSAGTYSVTVLNPDGEAATLDNVLTVNEPLTITRSEPQRITQGQPTTMTIQGSGFVEETTVQLSNIGVVSDTLVSDTTLMVNLPQSLDAGIYSVSVQNPTGESSTLPNALTVSAPEPTAIPLAITRSEPNRITRGQQYTLSVLGTGFTNGSVVRLVGFGLLDTTVLHNGAITAVVPSNIPVREYRVEITDASGQTVQSPNTLNVVAPPAQPAPTNAPPPSPTPMTIATSPSLGISNFVPSPSTITAGQTTRITFTVQNRGNQTARTIVISLASGSNFVVAGGQSSISIPDLVPNGVYNASMTVTAMQDIAVGAASIPLQISYRDNQGESLSTDAELSVTISPTANQSQLVIDAYVVEPTLAEPGQPVFVRMTLANRGNTLASQVVMRVASENSVLLPNGRGDTFVVGDMQPSTQTPIQLPLLVSSAAQNGVQLQPLTITYYQDGEAHETIANISVNIAAVNKPQPLLLLAGYETGFDVLQPGTRFTLNATLQNVGSASATSTTVTFGTVQSSGDGSGEPPSPDSGQNNTTPSSTFAPLGTAGLSFIGDVAVNATVEVSQAFIVAGDVTSGIYSLPITLQYQSPDNTNKQDVLSLSLVVLAPPRLRINPPNPLPESVNAGEPIPMMLEIINLGRTTVELTDATVTASNGEILDGATIQLDAVETEEDTSLTALIMPLEEGRLEVTVTLAYLNDLGQVETIELTYAADVMPAPPPPEEYVEPEPIVSEPEPDVNWFGRVLMAALGLGS